MIKPVIDVVAAVIERDSEYLLTQRKAKAVLPLLWEFPGGRVEAHESRSDALIREVSGRIGVPILIGETIGENTHKYTTYHVRMTLYSCSLASGATPMPIGVQQIRWVATDKLCEYEFPPADQASMSLLLNLCS